MKRPKGMKGAQMRTMREKQNWSQDELASYHASSPTVCRQARPLMVRADSLLRLLDTT
jgi:hypothetical protein